MINEDELIENLEFNHFYQERNQMEKSSADTLFESNPRLPWT